MNSMNNSRTIRRTLHKPIRHFVVGGLALALGLLAGAGSTHAATIIWTNTAGGYWADPLSWNPNVVPGPADDGTFNAAGSYTVTITNDTVAHGVWHAPPASTTQTLTLDLGGHSLSLLEGGTTQPTVWTIADGSSSTVIVYLVSSTGVGQLYCTNGGPRVTISRSGIGTLYVTNSTVVVGGSTVLANGGAGRGTLVLTGPDTYWTNSATFNVGNNAAAIGSSLVISNSASMTVQSSFSVGGQGSSSGANGHSLLLDTGGRLFTGNGGTISVGNVAGSNNTAIVRNGASWNNGNRILSIGASGAGNSLTIGSTATVVNVSSLGIASGNTLSLSGGLLQVSFAVTNLGTITGFGTIAGNTFVLSGSQLTPGLGTSVGTITFTNDLTLASGSTVTIKLDSLQSASNDFLNIAGTLTKAGTLSVVTNGTTALNVGDTYRIFACGSQSGSFSTINLPSLDPSKLWDTSQLGAGILAVTYQPVAPGMVGPVSQAYFPSNDVTISATVTGVPTPVLQWQRDGTNLVGYTTDTIFIPNAQVPDSGHYCLIASNNVGVAIGCMTLTIATNNLPPTVTDMSDQTVVQGNNGVFYASDPGLPVPTVQWQENGVDIPGATGIPLILTNVQYSMNGFVYSLIASNSEGTATNSATLHVIVTPVIATQPQSLVVTNTQSASFTVVSTNGIPAPTYQWYYNNGFLTGATNATYAIASATPANAGTYNVIVANAAGSVNSSNATLTVNSTMSAVLTPANAATGVCYDTPLYMAFDQAPFRTGAGKIKIFNATNSVTAVDTIDTGLGNLQTRTIGTENFSTFPIIITGNTVAIYPHLGVLTSNQTYYVTVDPATFTDTNAALYAGITDTNAWRFTTKPTGPANPNSVVVAADGSGDFCTVQGAVDFVPNNNVNRILINIRNGTYTELIDTRNKSTMTFRGQSRTGTIVQYRNNEGQNPGTHSRPSFKVYGNDIAIENMTLVNTTPQGGGQSEALMIESGAKRFILNNAEVDSRQDTILANVNSSQGYFYNSLVQGNFDYVWGGGNCYFTKCEFRTIPTANSYNLTASRTDNGATGNWPGNNGLLVSNGLSFVRCRLTRAGSSVTNITLAGSNGQLNGLASFIYCSIDTNCYITPSASVLSSQLLWEYGNSNLDNTASATFGLTPLSTNDARFLAASDAYTWLNNWNPLLAVNIIGQPTNLTVNASETATFAVSATGVPDPTYQWLKNGTNVLGATSATLIIVNAQGGTAQYSVIVSNAAGSVTSDTATLTVLSAAPVANFSASPASGPEPLAVTFTDTSTGTTAINLLWDLGDSTTTNTTGGASLVHTYAEGTYTVTLTASNELGTSTLVSNNVITAGISLFHAWQLQYFNCTNCSQAAATADPDGDGQNNMAEFLAGTSPTNGLSALRITSAVRQGNDVAISWTTAGGRTNVVQASAGGVNGSYTNNFVDIDGSTIVVPGSGDATTNYVDVAGATNAPSRFYRIRLAP